MQKKNILHIHIQINKVKDNKTITESIKNNIQNDIIKDNL